jgi:hypothetical protein
LSNQDKQQKSGCQIIICGIGLYFGQYMDLLAVVLVSQSCRGGRFVYQKLFPLKTLLEFLGQAIERRFPAKTKLFLPAL